ncbi:hypothetical protein NUW58_g31 [Xylaria curta]|uniref:Uncharacterized protein n=1 Tax=Xylaria curta TaxID=42375 RepID=A0ACC1PT86_9PEZI|nr:hypothetical protein NUW58_g31 [Xylaria curta]
MSQPPFRTPRMPCSVGVDLGSWGSKVGVAVLRPDKIPKAGRVARPANTRDPESSNTADDGNNVYEFAATAALEGDKLIPGKRSRDKDLNFSIKTVLLRATGIDQPHKLRNVPGGQSLVNDWAAGRITQSMAKACILEHLTKLRDETVKYTDSLGYQVEDVVITYPNWLCSFEGHADFDKYISFYLELMRPLWPGAEFNTVSEGQAAANYVCEPWKDAQNSFRRSDVWDQFEGLNMRVGVPICIFDHGGSSFNAQSQIMRLDENGGVINSQSIRGLRWKSGALGGSYLSNCEIQEIVRSNFLRLKSDGEVADLMADFERQKRNLDLSSKGAPPGLFLVSKSGKQILIHSQQLRDAFRKAFDNGFGVVFSGFDWSCAMRTGSTTPNAGPPPVSNRPTEDNEAWLRMGRRSTCNGLVL